MDANTYLQTLQQRLQYYYDNRPLPDAPQFVLAAELNAADEGYFVVPSLKTYSVQHNEYLYVARFTQPLTTELATPYLQFTKTAMGALKPTTEHMSSVFTLVLVCDVGIANEAIAQLVRTRQHKDYCFTLKGWADLALYLVDIPAQRLHFNKAGAKSQKLFAINGRD